MKGPLRAIGLALLVLVGGCTSDSGTTTPAPATGPFTDIFTSIIYPGDVLTHSFAATTAGTITVTLTNAGPPSTVVMGLGIGVPTPVGQGCSLTLTVNTAAGPTPQITQAVDSGTYCIAIFDVGNNIPAGESFSVTTVHP